MMPWVRIAGLMLLFCSLYLILWPVPVEPKAWEAPVSPGYTGDYSANTLLDKPVKLNLPELHGPEAAAFDQSGRLYLTTHEGWLVRANQNNDALEPWLDLGGRPLGLDIDAANTVWVANAYLGLQRVTADGDVTTVANKADGIAIRYADDVVVAPDGKVYFTDASTRFGAEEYYGTLEASLLDIMEHSDNGRVLVYDPDTGVATTVLDGLTFANGVALGPDGEYLLVVETGEYRVHKLWLAGERQGDVDIIIDNIPGFPDNIHSGHDGRFWIGLTAPRSAILDRLASKPGLRKMVQRLPAFMRPQVGLYGMVIGIDGEGTVVANLHSPNGNVYTTTGALESDTHLYVTSLTAPFLASYAKKDIGDF
jgi:sugar lactone lactonase YvrE